MGCAICFGSADPRMTFILMGLLALPFLMVGGMFTFLYYKGVFSTKQIDSNLSEASSK